MSFVEVGLEADSRVETKHTEHGTERRRRCGRRWRRRADCDSTERRRRQHQRQPDGLRRGGEVGGGRQGMGGAVGRPAGLARRAPDTALARPAVNGSNGSHWPAPRRPATEGRMQGVADALSRHKELLVYPSADPSSIPSVRYIVFR